MRLLASPWFALRPVGARSPLPGRSGEVRCPRPESAGPTARRRAGRGCAAVSHRLPASPSYRRTRLGGAISDSCNGPRPDGYAIARTAATGRFLAYTESASPALPLFGGARHSSTSRRPGAVRPKVSVPLRCPVNRPCGTAQRFQVPAVPARPAGSTHPGRVMPHVPARSRLIPLAVSVLATCAVTTLAVAPTSASTPRSTAAPLAAVAPAPQGPLATNPSDAPSAARSSAPAKVATQAVNSTLPVDHSCSSTLRVRAQQMTSGQLSSVCTSLAGQAALLPQRREERQQAGQR